MTSTPIRKRYYAATNLFLLLDKLFGVDLRVARLDDRPGGRAA